VRGPYSHPNQGTCIGLQPKLHITGLGPGEKAVLNVVKQVDIGDCAVIDSSEFAGVVINAMGSGSVKFGISVRGLSQGERQEANFQHNGVLVTGVDDNSFAEELGIRQGDIISAVNRQQVNSPEDLRRVATELKPGDAVAFKVMRNAGAMGMRGRNGADWQPFFVAGTLPQS
jgi:membrane-associated protease RseP (regulator of RpoE activity)